MRNMFFCFIAFSLVVNAVIFIQPTVDSCELSETSNAIVRYKMSASCTLSFSFNSTTQNDKCACSEDGMKVRHMNSTSQWVEESCDYKTSVDTVTVQIKVGGGKVYEYTKAWYDSDGSVMSSISTDEFDIDRPGLFDVEVLYDGDVMTSAKIRVIPGWITLLPPVVLFIVAYLTRQILIAMPVAICIGAWLIDENLNPIEGFWRTFDTYFVNSIGDTTHAYVITFTFLLAGIVCIISKSGGTQGVANSLVKYINSSSSALWVTYIEGLLIFFDDYADTLICGNTLKVFTDANRVSREKFAFLVDATAAPIASIAPLSSWIGFEIGLIQESFVDEYGEELGQSDAYMVFLETIPYRFYPWFMLFFILFLITLKRDFGPMVKAERRTRMTGKVIADGAQVDAAQLKGDPNMEPSDEVKERGDFYWWLAEIPILIVILGTFVGILTSGAKACGDQGIEKTAKNIFSNGDSFSAIIWACEVATLVAVGGAIYKKTLTVSESVEAWLYGIKTMVEPVILLLFAWGIGSLMKTMKTPDYIVESLGDSIPEESIAGISFLISALTSFFIGTSWGTMSIMFPLIVPLSYEVSNGNVDVMIHCMATILAGAVFGDHCSPISDTTVLSSLACGCDHQDHVTTQFFYAMPVGLIAVIFGDFCAAAGSPVSVCWIVGLLLMLIMIFAFGVRIPVYSPGKDGEEGTLEDDVPLDSLSPFESLLGFPVLSFPYEEGKDVEETKSEDGIEMPEKITDEDDGKRIPNTAVVQDEVE